MRTLSEIRQELSDKLASAFWSKLKSSLIGRELIAFGARVIQEQDAIVESINSAFDYTKASRKQLISISHSHFIGVSFIQPSSIRVTISGYNEDLELSPFNLRYELGNMTFYNVEFVTIPAYTTKSVDLYLGTLRAVCNTPNVTVLKNTVTADTPEFIDVQYWSGDGNNQVQMLKLGNALPTSAVVVYCNSTLSTMWIAPSLKALNAMITPKPYYLYTLSDGTLAVYLDTEGIEDLGLDYVVMYLESSAESFDVSLIESGSGALKIPNASGTLFITISDDYYTINSWLQGSNNSLEFAREIFRRVYLETNAVVSESQIREFVNAFTSIQDSAVTALNNNIRVYVKPVVQSNTGPFGDIESALDLHGVLLTTHKVYSGNPVEFGLKISGVPVGQRSNIISYLQSELAYSKLPYDYKVSVMNLAAQISTITGQPAYVTLLLSMIYSAFITLPFKPREGTIKLLDTDLQEIGYDAGGTLYGASSVQVQWNVYSTLDLLNDFAYVFFLSRPDASTYEFYLTSPGTTNVACLASPNGPLGVRDVATVDITNYILASNANSQVISIIPKASLSIGSVDSPTINGFVKSIIAADLATRNLIVSKTERLAVYIKDDKLYYLSYLAGVLQVHYCTFVTGELKELFVYEINYTVHSSYASSEHQAFLGIAVQGGDMIIYTATDAILIFNYDSISWSYQVVDVPWSPSHITSLSLDKLSTATRIGHVPNDDEIEIFFGDAALPTSISSIRYKTPVISVSGLTFGGSITLFDNVALPNDYTTLKLYGGAKNHMIIAEKATSTNNELMLVDVQTSTPNWELVKQMNILQNVGTVNYETGDFACSAVASRIAYESSDSPNLKEDSYLKYNDTVEWDS